MQDEDIWTQYGCFQRCSHMEQLSKSLRGSKSSDKVQKINSWVDTVFMYLLYLFLSYFIHFSLNIVILTYLFDSASEFGNKNSFTKKSNHSKENNPLQAKKVFGFVEHFSEFVKGTYQIWELNFFDLAIIIIVVVVFLIVQFILCFTLFYQQLAKNSEKQWKTLGYQVRVKFFYLHVTSWDIQF